MATQSPSKVSVYQEFLAEREEVMRHKWLSSEQSGKDVGFDTALIEWAIKHRVEWKKRRTEEIEKGST